MVYSRFRADVRGLDYLGAFEAQVPSASLRSNADYNGAIAVMRESAVTQPNAIEAKLMVEPSYWLEQGVQLDANGGLPLFRFTETLQARSDELLSLSKSEALSKEQQAELDSLSQLSQIFTYANSLLAAQALWSLPHSENSSPSEPLPVVNIATPQNS